MGPTADLTLRIASAQDLAVIHDLLERSGLPTSDLSTARPQFVVATRGNQIIGTGALECFGSVALLRSLAVEARSRGLGVGGLIVSELERYARDTGIGELFLLTQTAGDFFAHRGYKVIDRSMAPKAVRDTAEFRSLCPASAFCMAKFA